MEPVDEPGGAAWRPLPRRPRRRAPTQTPAARRAAGGPAAGQLTNGWRFVTGLAWALVIVAYAAVWKTSAELGLNTWWLGPFGDPQPRS